jgi:hypothetical protein
VVADRAETEVEHCDTEDEKKEMAEDDVIDEEGQTELSKEKQVGVTSEVYCVLAGTALHCKTHTAMQCRAVWCSAVR